MDSVQRSLRRRPTVRRLLPAVISLISVGAIIVSVGSLLGPGAAFEPQALPQRRDPLLPDLIMTPIEDVNPGYSAGAPLLRFGATIANVGAGDFLAAARRPAPWSDDWAVSQRVQEAGGGFTERMTPGDLVFGGDEHGHWHVVALESHRLARVDTGEVVGQVLKQGFCPYDTDVYRPDLPRAPRAPFYPESGCGGRFAIALRVGVSVGWGDEYAWDLIEQKVDLTGVPAGRYRIVQIADPFNLFEELDETNNETWVEIDFEMQGIIPSIKVVDRASSP